jgi:hypothetical protein
MNTTIPRSGSQEVPPPPDAPFILRIDKLDLIVDLTDQNVRALSGRGLPEFVQAVRYYFGADLHSEPLVLVGKDGRTWSVKASCGYFTLQFIGKTVEEADFYSRLNKIPRKLKSGETWTDDRIDKRLSKLIPEPPPPRRPPENPEENPEQTIPVDTPYNRLCRPRTVFEIFLPSLLKIRVTNPLQYRLDPAPYMENLTELLILLQRSGLDTTMIGAEIALDTTSPELGRWIHRYACLVKGGKLSAFHFHDYTDRGVRRIPKTPGGNPITPGQSEYQGTSRNARQLKTYSRPTWRGGPEIHRAEFILRRRLIRRQNAKRGFSFWDEPLLGIVAWAEQIVRDNIEFRSLDQRRLLKDHPRLRSLHLESLSTRGQLHLLNAHRNEIPGGIGQYFRPLPFPNLTAPKILVNPSSEEPFIVNRRVYELTACSGS